MEPSRLNTTGQSKFYSPVGGNNANLNVPSSSASYYGRGVSPTDVTHTLPTAHGVDSTRLPAGNNRYWYNPNEVDVLLNDLEPPKIWNQLYQDYAIELTDIDDLIALKTRKRQTDRMFQLLQNWFKDSNEQQRTVVFKGLCKALTDGCRRHLIGCLNLRYVPQAYLEDLRLSGASAFGHYPVQPVTEQLTGLQIARPTDLQTAHPLAASRQPVEHAETEEVVRQPSQQPQPSVEVLLRYSTEESMQNPQGGRW